MLLLVSGCGYGLQVGCRFAELSEKVTCAAVKCDIGFEGEGEGAAGRYSCGDLLRWDLVREDEWAEVLYGLVELPDYCVKEIVGRQDRSSSSGEQPPEQVNPRALG